MTEDSLLNQVDGGALSHRLAEHSRQIEHRAKAAGIPDSHMETDRSWEQDVLNPLCRVDRQTEDRLRRHNFLENHVGAECTKPSTWRQRRREAVDEQLFLYLLWDCIEAHFVFYKLYHFFEDDTAFTNAVQDRTVSSHCPHNIVTTHTWLQEIEAPTELVSRQHQLSSWSR